MSNNKQIKTEDIEVKSNIFDKLSNTCKPLLKYVDYSIDFITKEESLKRSEIVQIARKPILFGIWVSVATFLVCGVWAGFAPIDSAAVAQGVVVLDSERKIVQHLEGGIVEKILVKNGDKVEAGQTLIILDNTRAKSSLGISYVQIQSLKVTQARLIAESEDLSKITYPKDIEDSTEEEIIKFRQIQNKLFETRRAALESKINSIKHKIEQHKKMIISYNSQLKSNQLQLKYTQEQYDSTKQLVGQGQGTKPRLLDLQTKIAHYEGQIGDVGAKIAQTNSAISGDEVEIITYRTDFLNNVIKELRETQTNIAANEEEMKHKADTLKRVNITAPVSGIVNNLQVHTIGGVVPQGGGQALLEIIPQDDKLVIDVNIKPEDIDLVNEGSLAKVRLLAYKSRTTPALDGIVTHVSAETVASRYEGGRPYYKAKVEIDPGQFEKKKINKFPLYPGMPAQIFIVTGSRTLVKYLLDPVIDSMRKSFRER